MSRKVIITCALTGGVALGPNSRHVPVTPEQIASEALASAEAGAAIVHIHVRDSSTGAPSLEVALFEEVVERIRERNRDLILNLSTGQGARYVPPVDDPQATKPGDTVLPAHQRATHVARLRPEICSLDVATLNFGEIGFVNTPAHVRAIARIARDAGVKPELELFDTGHLRLALAMIEAGDLPQPPFFQFCLGISWGAPATAETMLLMRSMLPEGAVWSAFGVGRHQMPTVAQSVLLGGHVRVGLEDNLYLRPGELSPGNAPLVEKAANIVQALDAEVATPADARGILSL